MNVALAQARARDAHERARPRLARVLARWPARWRAFTLNNLQRLLDSLAVLQHRDTMISTAFWTALTWGLGISVNYAVQRAFGLARQIQSKDRPKRYFIGKAAIT